MKTCYLCPRVLEGENITDEHIILNAIGGTLKSKKLICRTCNSELGHSADKELSKQLAPLAGLLQIKGEDKEIQDIRGVITGTDEGIRLKEGHTPEFSKLDFNIEKIDEKSAAISIRARNEKEMFKKFEELKVKYPTFDVEEAKKSIVHSKEYLEMVTIPMTIGGNLANRSIVKTAVNYYIHKRNDGKTVSHLFEYLKEKNELNICKHFYPDNSIYNQDNNELVHLLHLVGDSESKKLYCYVEFFSTYSFIVKLSDEYYGKSFTDTYCEDVLLKEVIQKKVNLKLSDIENSNLFSYTKDEFENIQKRFARTKMIIKRVQDSKAVELIVNEVIENQMKRGVPFTINDVLHEAFQEVDKMIRRGKKNLES